MRTLCKIMGLIGFLTISGSMAHANCINTGGNCTAGNSGPTAQSTANAKAGAIATNRTRVTNNAAAQGGIGYGGVGGSAQASGGAGGSGGSVGDMVVSNGTGGYPRQAASAYAPSLYGSNPCSGAGVSAGLQLPMVGLSAGSQSYDDACRLHQLGMDAAAVELLCQKDSIRQAMYYAALKRMGDPCLADVDRLNKEFTRYGQPPGRMISATRN